MQLIFNYSPSSLHSLFILAVLGGIDCVRHNRVGLPIASYKQPVHICFQIGGQICIVSVVNFLRSQIQLVCLMLLLGHVVLGPIFRTGTRFLRLTQESAKVNETHDSVVHKYFCVWGFEIVNHRRAREREREQEEKKPVSDE